MRSQKTQKETLIKTVVRYHLGVIKQYLSWTVWNTNNHSKTSRNFLNNNIGVFKRISISWQLKYIGIIKNYCKFSKSVNFKLMSATLHNHGYTASVNIFSFRGGVSLQYEHITFECWFSCCFFFHEMVLIWNYRVKDPLNIVECLSSNYNLYRVKPLTKTTLKLTPLLQRDIPFLKLHTIFHSLNKDRPTIKTTIYQSQNVVLIAGFYCIGIILDFFRISGK